MSKDFPSSKFERGKIFAKTGLKLGTNYAKRYLERSIGKQKTAGENSKFHSENARQVFNEFTRLRGTALKVAQSISMDQGFLPREFSEVMAEAQYRVPPINKALVRSIIKKELGAYPESLFADFQQEAMAAASIGQVHRATHKNGTPLAIKIQYPNVRDTIDSDLGLIKSLMKRLMKKGVNLDEYLEEIRSTLLEETDYEREGYYLDYFYNRFSRDSVITPEWYEELSSRKVLTMSYIEGKHLHEFLEGNPSQDERNHFGQLLWDFFHDQVSQRDFIHADTHPGNFFFREDGRLGVIDFGCVKKFPVEFTYNYLLLLPTHLQNDDAKVRRLFLELGITRENPDDPEKEERFYRFCKNYGEAFSEPYLGDAFDFGSPHFKEKINRFSREFPIMNEPRGDKNFIYSTRVHLGLYSLLMQLEAEVDTRRSKEIAFSVLDQIDVAEEDVAAAP